MKVIFIAPKKNISVNNLKRLKNHTEVEFYEEEPIDIRDLKVLKEVGDKILCPFPEPMNWDFPNDFIGKIVDLKGICLSTTGYDWIDGKKLRSMGIPLTNVPQTSTNAIAETAMFMMFAVARKFSKVRKIEKFDFVPGNELCETRGKTMGIIGLGNVGRRIAELGKSLGMKVVYWSRKSRDNDYKYVEMDKLLRSSDFIFPCLALNEDTENFISKKEINLINKNASVINVARKGVIDIDYVVEKVRKGELYGCAFEVNDYFENKEKYEYSENIFVLPHNNWFTKETMEEKMKIWIESIISVVKGKPVNVVN